MITPFYRHGILSNSGSMTWLAHELGKTGKFYEPNNETYEWRDMILCSGLSLATSVLASGYKDKVLLVGHSQGGLVCRVAAVALTGRHLGTTSFYTQRVIDWRRKHGAPDKFSGKLAVVTLATPNSGAMSFGQMSVAAEILTKSTMEAARVLGNVCNLGDLVTPRLFQEFENWRVHAKYLSISAVCVNRYRRGLLRNLAALLPIRRISVRFDLPNDNLVEDSSTDLRQCLIRPEVDLTNCYRHTRVYPNSIELDHKSVRESSDVANVIKKNLGWLFG